MNKRSGPDVLMARTSFWVTVNRKQLLVRAGDIWAADDPVVMADPDNFGPLRVHSSEDRPRVEQATAAPGERRGERKTA